MFLFVALWASTGWSATEISNVRHWTAPDHTRVVFDLGEEPDYQFNIGENILILEFADTVIGKKIPPEVIVNRSGIKKIIFASEGDNRCLVKIVLDHCIKVDIFKLKKFMDKPDRVVVDVIVAQTIKDEAVREQAKPSRKKKVIVIDPGHGGEDPGAVGKKGTYEKDVVLAIGREIKKAIDRLPGYRAALTRDGDYYVSFSKRLAVARETDASLFISVHADAARNRRAKGSSVYCLSTGAASNEAAKLLANNENLSDIIGGVPEGEGNNQSDEIILNMFQTNTINLSKTYAADLIAQIGRVHHLKYSTFHEAPFRVLKLLNIPAVLLETAYLSNAQEERLLKTGKFRKTLASAVASSVNKYFSSVSLVAQASVTAQSSSMAKKTADAAPPVKATIYQVRRGDSLHAIARQHETDLVTLLKLNDMNVSDALYAGQKIRVPVLEKETAAGRPLKRYTVQKGDTLFSLAKNSSVTVDELRRLNNMTPSDVLLFGQRIKLPQ